MSNSRRQRHKLLLITHLSAPLILILAALQIQCHPQPILSHFQVGITKQYNNNVRSSNNFLVSDQSQQIAQSLPLTRQTQAQQVDLDNVIESTTSLVALQNAPSARQSASASLSSPISCQLPPTWAGKWYQSNKEPIRVTNTEISDKGVCRDQKGDKYLFEYAGNTKQQSTPCLVCLVINERHLNVLQYKESTCQSIPANHYNRSTNNLILDEDHSLLDSICSDITGDAQLESLFRLETPAIECPIYGQYSFTYDSCREPQSSLDSCIDKKQLNFKFSACPDVPGSESKSEVLKCYADWSEGNNYYMIGRLEHASNHQDKGKFRCFVYEKSLDGKFIQMAQSSEESCYGLINANEGPKTLRLTIKPPTIHKCHFPTYIQSQSENWLSVDNSLIYMFNQNSTKYQVKETKEGNVIEEATCLQQITYPQAHTHPHHPHSRSNNNNQQVITNRRYSSASTASYPQADQSLQQQQVTSKSSTNDVVYLVQITKNCHTTNYCVRFYKRSSGIVQIDYFINSDNQCRNAFIGASPQTQIITSTNLEHQRCPFEGAYTIEAPIESDLTYNPSNIFICPRQSFLTAQCDHPSRLRIHSKCSSGKFLVKNLYCLGSWTTNGLVRLLLADDDRQRFSAWYRDYVALQPSQDGASSIDSAQAQLTAASLAPIVDLQIALITPVPIIAKPMQVRLTRRSQCSELRGYTSQGAYGSSPISAFSSSMSSYVSPATASSAATAQMTALQYLTNSSILILIVTLLLPLINRVTLS